LKVIIV